MEGFAAKEMNGSNKRSHVGQDFCELGVPKRWWKIVSFGIKIRWKIKGRSFFGSKSIFPLKKMLLINPKKSQKKTYNLGCSRGWQTFEWLCPSSPWQVLTFTQLLGVTWTNSTKIPPSCWVTWNFLFEGHSYTPKKLRFCSQTWRWIVQVMFLFMFWCDFRI